MVNEPDFPTDLFHRDLFSLAKQCVAQCRSQNKVVSFAESCTGGLLAALITSVSGSSDVFKQSFVTYSNEAKQSLLGVSAGLLREHGAVSSQCAGAMARHCLQRTKADVSVGVTGIAGPTGGTDVKPVGLVYIALSHRPPAQALGVKACEPVTQIYDYRFGTIQRDLIRQKSAYQALTLVHKYLTNIEPN